MNTHDLIIASTKDAVNKFLRALEWEPVPFVEQTFCPVAGAMYKSKKTQQSVGVTYWCNSTGTQGQITMITVANNKRYAYGIYLGDTQYLQELLNKTAAHAENQSAADIERLKIALTT